MGLAAGRKLELPVHALMNLCLDQALVTPNHTQASHIGTHAEEPLNRHFTLWPSLAQKIALTLIG